ncbi:MAG: hypothetical protein IVW57_13770 [Ktedonobacterales bacterium]|nr:hypothetical protein [Ktedonobacterales bacterium]
MPNAMPPSPHSRPPAETPAETPTGASARLGARRGAPAPTGRRPRVRAALCYAVPIIPAATTLLREPRDRFVRLHAARALLFFALLALAQALLLLWLVVLGNAADGRLAVALGLLLYAAVLALGITALTLWLRWVAASLAGHAVTPTGLGRAAARLERWSLRLATGMPAPSDRAGTEKKNPLP